MQKWEGMCVCVGAGCSCRWYTLIPFSRTTPLAGRALTQRLSRLLLTHSRLVLPSDLPREQAPHNPIPATLLTPTLLEDIKSRFLFVSPVMISERDRQDGSKIS